MQLINYFKTRLDGRIDTVYKQRFTTNLTFRMFRRTPLEVTV